ncbi:MAG: glycerophosphodiester phosphodiesterase family protein [Bacteroidota bacterium]
MRTRLAPLLFLFVFTSTTLSGQLSGILEKFHDAESEYVLVAAHRSVHNRGCPENSVSAIRSAIELGVDIVELDVRLTRDSVPVLMHDETIDRTTNGNGKVSDYTLAELKEFRLKREGGSLSGETIPTFTEALEAALDRIMVDIDLKTDQVVPIVKAVKETETQLQVFYFDSNYKLLNEICNLDEHAMIMPRAYSLEMADSAIQLFAPPVVHIDPSFYSAEVTELIRINNARIWINALGLPDLRIRLGFPGKAVKRLIRHGANILQTDEPEKLLAYLRSEGLHD